MLSKKITFWAITSTDGEYSRSSDKEYFDSFEEAFKNKNNYQGWWGSNSKLCCYQIGGDAKTKKTIHEISFFRDNFKIETYSGIGLRSKRNERPIKEIYDYFGYKAFKIPEEYPSALDEERIRKIKSAKENAELEKKMEEMNRQNWEKVLRLFGK